MQNIRESQTEKNQLSTHLDATGCPGRRRFTMSPRNSDQVSAQLLTHCMTLGEIHVFLGFFTFIIQEINRLDQMTQEISSDKLTMFYLWLFKEKGFFY